MFFGGTQCRYVCNKGMKCCNWTVFERCSFNFTNCATKISLRQNFIMQQ